MTMNNERKSREPHSRRLEPPSVIQNENDCVVVVEDALWKHHTKVLKVNLLKIFMTLSRMSLRVSEVEHLRVGRPKNDFY